MTANSSRRKRGGRRVYDDELKGEAVQMLLDGHSAEVVARNLGLSSVSLLYRWKAKYGGLEVSEAKRLRQLEEENRQLKHVVAELTLDKRALQAVLSKKW
mgnify:CR=1 FL=1